MISTVEYHDTFIRYSDEGYGEPVVLLHGYLESLEIWDGFGNELARDYRVICIDLPGHGRSGVCAALDTMAIMADAVKSVLDFLGIGRTVIIGHSMGGYAALAFEDFYPETTIGFGLFHSHALPDPADILANRDREIELVKAGKKQQFINVNISNAFATDNHDKLADKIDWARKIALATPDEGVIHALEGMKARPDRRDVLKVSTDPVLIIAGRKDNYIPFEVYEQHFKLAPDTEVVILENSGHMGFVEEKEQSLEGIRQFLRKIYS
ncbi:MAG TPA: alpha/beta hydrolase [Bacteroides sp.]|nr:alpha/beta hydrolase [Bacteroides sp.]